MNQVLEPERSIPVLYDVDLVVAGGGTSGIAAAVCAGRLGLSVVMVEQACTPGGMFAQLHWSNDFTHKGGICAEIFNHLETENALVRQNGYCRYNPFVVPPYLDSLLASANVEVLYRATVAGVLKEDRAIKGIFVETKQGRIAIKARVVIDATGDGDVAVAAGARYAYGREKDGATQAISLIQLYLRYEAGRVNSQEIEKELRAVAPGFRMPYVHGDWDSQFGLTQAMLNGTTHVCGHDPLTAAGLSKALCALRAQSYELFKALSNTSRMARLEFGPFAPLPGIRETRRIRCDYGMTYADTQAGSHFDDGLFTVTQPIDIHKCNDSEPGIRVEPVKPYQIPYRSLLPQGVENLLVVGRCIDGEHEALASYRIMSNCFAMGEAAALAAHEVKQGAASPREVDPRRLIQELARRGFKYS